MGALRLFVSGDRTQTHFEGNPLARSVSGKTTRAPTRTTSKSAALKPRTAKAATKTTKTATAAAKTAKSKTVGKATAAKPRTASKATPRKTSSKTGVLSKSARTATIAAPTKGEPMLASFPASSLPQGATGLTSPEALADQVLNLPPVFRQDAERVSANGRIARHKTTVYSDLKAGSATERVSVGWLSMTLDQSKDRGKARKQMVIELPNRTVEIVEAYIKFSEEEPSSASFYPYDYYGEENKVGFIGVLPFSRMAPMVQIIGGYEDNHANMFFDLIVADDDISVSRFYVETSMREDEPERRKKPKTRR